MEFKLYSSATFQRNYRHCMFEAKYSKQLFNPLPTGNCCDIAYSYSHMFITCYEKRGYISSRFSRNSEPFGSEFLENLEKCILHSDVSICGYFQPHNSVLPVLKWLRLPIKHVSTILM